MAHVKQLQFPLLTLLTLNFVLSNRTQLTVNCEHRIKNSGQLIDKNSKKADSTKKSTVTASECYCSMYSNGEEAFIVTHLVCLLNFQTVRMGYSGACSYFLM